MGFQRGMRPITMPEQELAMLQHRPAITRTGRRPWVWRCRISARPGGQAYVFDIDGGHWSGGGVKIWCREPALIPELVTGRPPHTFADGSLCVSDRLPEDFEFIALTTVPWLYSWLFFYEHWLDTGEWIGPQELLHAGDVRQRDPAEAGTARGHRCVQSLLAHPVADGLLGAPEGMGLPRGSSAWAHRGKGRPVVRPNRAPGAP